MCGPRARQAPRLRAFWALGIKAVALPQAPGVVTWVYQEWVRGLCCKGPWEAVGQAGVRRACKACQRFHVGVGFAPKYAMDDRDRLLGTRGLTTVAGIPRIGESSIPRN